MNGPIGQAAGRSRGGMDQDSEATWSLPSSRASSFAAAFLPGHWLSIFPPNHTKPVLVDAVNGTGSPRL